MQCRVISSKCNDARRCNYVIVSALYLLRNKNPVGGAGTNGAMVVSGGAETANARYPSTVVKRAKMHITTGRTRHNTPTCHAQNYPTAVGHISPVIDCFVQIALITTAMPAARANAAAVSFTRVNLRGIRLSFPSFMESESPLTRQCAMRIILRHRSTRLPALPDKTLPPRIRILCRFSVAACDLLSV